MMYTNFEKLNGLKSVKVAQMDIQVTERRVKSAHKISGCFSSFFGCPFFEPLALSGTGCDSPRPGSCIAVLLICFLFPGSGIYFRLFDIRGAHWCCP